MCDDLTGNTADLMASAVERSVKGQSHAAGGSLGMVIVSKQRTARDGEATLKFNCSQDDLIKKLIDRYDILADVPEEAVMVRLEHETEVIQRSSVLSSLEEAVTYEADDPRIYHGRLFSSLCLAEPSASESGKLEDSLKVMDHKIRYMRDLLRMSKRTLVYTEAVTSLQHSHEAHYGAKQCEINHSHNGEDEAAEDVKIPPSYEAASTLASVGLVQAWVQLGHDGLAQEAGCPLQVREVYDSWRQQERGSYRQELEAVDTEISSADLILVFGPRPALTGDTASGLADICGREFGDLGPSLGLVIISETATALDNIATIRVNGSPDTVLVKLAEELDVASMEAVVIKPTLVEACDEAPDIGSIALDESHHDQDKKENDGETPVACLDSSHRAFVTDALTHFKEIQEQDPRIHHGRMLSETCLETPEEDDGFLEDVEHTLDYKIEKMINLVKMSKKTVFVVDAVNSDPISCTLKSELEPEAQNKLLLTSYLKQQSLIELIIQFGHDGIPQRAGFHPDQVFEIHDQEDLSSEELEKIRLSLDNTDLVVLSSNRLETLDMLTDKVSSNSMTGLRYEDGGALGFVTIGTVRTKHDRLASLKINCEINKTIKMLTNKLDINEDCLQDGRSCTGLEHRHLLGSVKRVAAAGDTTETSSDHGELLRGKVLTDPEEQGDKYLDYETALSTKISYLNILVTASRRTVILSEAESRQVFVSGCGAPGVWGAKCGMSDPDNLPSPLHYQLAALHHSELVQVQITDHLDYSHDNILRPGYNTVTMDCPRGRASVWTA